MPRVGRIAGRATAKGGNMNSFRLRRLTFAGGTALCLAAIAVAAGGAATHDGGQRQDLPGTKPAWTSAVTTSGNVPAGQQVNAKVWLAPRNSAQLDALAQAVSRTGRSIRKT